MASIFKRGPDKGKRHARYWIEYTDWRGKRRRRKGLTDKALTEQLAAKIEHEEMLRAKGLIDPADEKRAEHSKAEIRTHLDAFEQALRKNSPKHITLTMSRTRRVVNGIGATSISEIEPEAVEYYLSELVSEGEIGHRTYNHYLQAIDSFCNWLVATKRIAANPLVGMKRLNTEVDVRHRRRALTSDEFARLVKSAKESKQEIQCYSGEERARIYLLSYMTGLRRKEIASLTPNSFDLDANPATVTVDAACSKHRRRDVLPLHPELVAELRGWLEGHTDKQHLFPKLEKRRTWLMVKKDLERVKIPYENQDGIADFHAAGRHTHITELLRNGASLTEARELARHSDVRMTMRYTHVNIEEQAKALERLSLEHIWSISRGPDGQNPTSGDASCPDDEEDPETPNPRRSEGYDESCPVMTSSGMEDASVEAAGIEPASRGTSMRASTCVA